MAARKKTTLSLHEVNINNDYRVLTVNENENKSVNMLFGKILLSIYFFLAILNVAAVALVLFVYGWLQFYVMIGTASSMLLTSVCGYYGIYRFGTIKDEMERLKENGIFYESEQCKLSETRKRLKTNIKELETEIKGMNAESARLRESESEFCELMKNLNKICGRNEDKMEFVDECNDSLQRMTDLIRLSVKRYLICSYFEAALCDKDTSMNKAEYEKFLCRITKKWRNKFIKMGNFEELFDKKQNEQINVTMFGLIVDKLLNQSTDFMHTEFDRCLLSEKSETESVTPPLLRTNVQRSIKFEEFAKKCNLNVDDLRNELTANNKVYEWLRKLNMAKYFDKFVENGYDELDSIGGIEKKDLKQMGVSLGHIDVIMAAANIVPFMNEKVKLKSVEYGTFIHEYGNPIKHKNNGIRCKLQHNDKQGAVWLFDVFDDDLSCFRLKHVVSGSYLRILGHEKSVDTRSPWQANMCKLGA